MRYIGRFLLWLIGVTLGVCCLLAAVMGVSYSFTRAGALPASEAAFGGVELECNGYRWQVPLLGGVLDKGFRSPETLTVQKLGSLAEAHPALTVPAWATGARLTIQNAQGAVVFEGTLEEYESFLYPANGEYKAGIWVWRAPAGLDTAAFMATGAPAICRNAGLERPARPTGYYHYQVRYTLDAQLQLQLSASRISQGEIARLDITGMVGEGVPQVSTDLGRVDCIRCAGGWQCYIPAAYNADAGTHIIEVEVNGQQLQLSLTVAATDFGEAETEPEPEATAEANEEFRNAVWPLYEQGAGEKRWSGTFLCPVEQYVVLVDYGQQKLVAGQRTGRSNSTLLYTIPGEPCRAPADGTVVLARQLGLTGNTVVIDHGAGLRSYLYGLAAISVQQGQQVARGDAVGALGETMTMDFKLASKSVNPWRLFNSIL